MMRARAAAMVLVVFLASCDVGGESEPGCQLATDGSTSDTLLGVKIDGRQTLISTRNAEWAVIALDSAGDLHLRFGRRTLLGSEFFQFDVGGFEGVGAYPINYRFDPRDVFAVYDCTIGFERDGFWAYGNGPADSLWVTTFDSLTGAIEASFSFRGEDWDRNAEFTDGVIRGVATTPWGVSP
jgi:hypothetical protein